MLTNAPLLAIVAVHTAENEPPKVLRNAKTLSIQEAAVAFVQAILFDVRPEGLRDLTVLT